MKDIWRCSNHFVTMGIIHSSVTLDANDDEPETVDNGLETRWSIWMTG
jgi:hypothetical protein